MGLHERQRNRGVLGPRRGRVPDVQERLRPREEQGRSPQKHHRPGRDPPGVGDVAVFVMKWRTGTCTPPDSERTWGLEVSRSGEYNVER